MAALSREDAFPEDQTGEVQPTSDIQAHVALGIRGDILFEKIKLEVKLTGFAPLKPIPFFCPFPWLLS